MGEQPCPAVRRETLQALPPSGNLRFLAIRGESLTPRLGDKVGAETEAAELLVSILTAPGAADTGGTPTPPPGMLEVRGAAVRIQMVASMDSPALFSRMPGLVPGRMTVGC